MTIASKFFFLDFETSGKNPNICDVIEIAVRTNEGVTFQRLVQPKSNELISGRITEITNISNGMLRRSGIPWHQAYKEFYEWLLRNLQAEGVNVFVAHNGLTFDFPILKRLFEEMQSELSLDVSEIDLYRTIFLDTVLISRRHLNHIGSHKQEALCSYYKIDDRGAHRALNDVKALMKIYKLMMDGISEEEDIDVSNPYAIKLYQRA